MTRDAVPYVRVKLMLALVLFACLSSPMLYGQRESGSIQGTVTDQSGAVVPAARVTLTNEATAFTTTTVTAPGGTYSFTPIKIGTYSVSVELQGFQKEIRPHITVDVQQQVVVDFTLRPGMVTQTVEVTSAVPLLQTQNASVGQVVGGQAINDLPLNGRNFTFLAQLSAGVNEMQQDSRGFGASGGFSANGVRSESNNYLLDGIDNNNDSQDFLNGTYYVALPPVDAIAEFKVETGNYSAEFGRAGGAALNATLKSGTNKFHGDAWEFLRNDALDSSDFFNNVAGLKKGEFRQNQFGATAGGPIKKNKTFVFGDYQGTRVRQALVYEKTVPTALMTSSGYANFSDLYSQSTGSVTDALGRTYKVGQIFDPATTRAVTAGQVDPVSSLTAVSTGYVRDPFAGNILPVGRIDQNAVKLLNLFPAPTLPGLVNNYASTPIQSLTADSFDARVDQNFSERDQMFGRMSYTRNPRYIPGPFPGVADGGAFNGGQQTVGTRNIAVSETHSFNSTTINSFRASFGRVHTLYAPTVENQLGIPAQYGIQGIPQVALNGGLPQFSLTGLTPFGQSTYTPINEWDETWDVANSLTKVHKSHTFKAGFEGIYLRFATYQPADPRGSDTFSGVYTSIPGQNVNNSGAVQFVLTPAPASVPGGIDFNGGPNSVAITRISVTDARRSYFAGYFQDDWKVARKLTLNLGIRWEYFPAIIEDHDAQSNFIAGTPGVNATFLIPKSRQNDPNSVLSSSFTSLLQKDGINLEYVSDRGLRNAQKDNFAPRFGFAYRATDKLVVRGGYAISYNGLEGVGYGPALGATYPFAFTLSYSNTSNQTPILFANGQNATLENAYGNITLVSSNVAGAGVTLRGIEQNLKTAYVQSTNLTAQYQLTPTTSFQLAYVGTFGRHIESNGGQANPITELLGPSANSAPFREYPDFAPGGAGGVQESWGSMYYNGLQTNLERQFSNGLNLLTNYTWSKCRTDSSDQLNATAISYRAAGLGPTIDYGPCDSDIRQVFHFSGGYDLPFGNGKRYLTNSRGAVNQIVSGWQAHGILTLEDGQPFTIPCRVGTDSGMSCVAFMVPGQSVIGGPHNVNEWMNPLAFANAPAVATNGQTNLAPLGGTRGQVVGPGFHRLDFSLFKEFKTTEKTHLEFRAEFFNLTNHPNFSTPLGPTGGTAVVSAPGALDWLNGNWGKISATRDTPNDPRQIQFGLKFYW